MATHSYFKNFTTKAKSILPSWAFKKVHQKAMASAGGYGKQRKMKKDGTGAAPSGSMGSSGMGPGLPSQGSDGPGINDTHINAPFLVPKAKKKKRKKIIKATPTRSPVNTGFDGMQKRVIGMDYELKNGATNEDEANDTVSHVLAFDPDFYTNAVNQDFGKEPNRQMAFKIDTAEGSAQPLNLDLGSGVAREPYHIGLDTYPHDSGTIVHDLTLGIPFEDESVGGIRLCNILHEYGGDPQDLLNEADRVLQPGGSLYYQGPQPLDMGNTFYEESHETNAQEVNKADGDDSAATECHTQSFIKLPDPATADDSAPLADFDPESSDVSNDQIGAITEPLEEYDNAFAQKSQSVKKKKLKKGGPGSGPTPGGGLNALNHTASPSNTALNSRHATQIEHDKRENEKKLTQIKERAARNTQMYSRQAHANSVSAFKSAHGIHSHQIKPGALVSKILKSGKKVAVAKLDPYQQIVSGVILTPNEEDAQGDWMSAQDIEKAAHSYMIKARVIGSNHSKVANAVPVESYIAPVDFTMDEGPYGPQKVMKGAWVLAVKVTDPVEWKKVLTGDYQGFSVGGFGTRA
jgi:SAM-dependent methyltransferase